MTEHFINTIEGLFRSNTECVLTTEYNYIGGNPVVFKQPLFDKIVEVYSQNPTLMLDPEYAHFQAQSVLEGTKWREPPKNGVMFEEKLFHDLGREWRKRNKLGKISRDRHSPITWVKNDKGESEICD
jgi:hypothetical protein